MRYWKFMILLLPIAALMGWQMAKQNEKQVQANMTQNDPIEQKVEELLKKMTLEEKIGQMVQYNGSWDVTGPAPTGEAAKLKYDQLKKGLVGSMLNVTSVEDTRRAQELAVESSRLGIPLIIGYDVIHGYQTMFPIPLGEAASWDTKAMETSARVAATEAAAAGIHWTFAPMVDITRDARWGRVMETAGEDPYLGSLAAAARVRGFQGEDLAANNTIAACAKHFAAYGFAESGRDYNTVEISDNTLHNIVLPPFKAASDAGVLTFMNGFEDMNGTPVTANGYLQRTLLKEEWGFDGFIVSDWGSIMEIHRHGMAKDLAQAAQIAANAGSDMDMEGYAYVNHLADEVKAGRVEMKHIDDAVRRILRVKFKLGLFDDPYKYCDAEREKTTLGAKEHQDLARDVARKSIVLLKNEGNLLPLAKNAGKIAVIGPFADDKDTPLGSWRAKAIEGSAVSLLEGVKSAIGNQSRIKYEQGCIHAIGKRSFVEELTINETDLTGISAAATLAKESDLVILAIGEDCWQSGEGRSQTDIGLLGVQEELFAAVMEANKNVVVVLMNGRPLAIPEVYEQAPAILETWHLGSQAGHAIADVLFGDYAPMGRLPISIPRANGQVPVYYNHKNTGRPAPESPNSVFWSHYTDELNSPQYPFGYGLTYTEFAYSDLLLSNNAMTENGKLTASITVKNVGSKAGSEVVQLYIQDLYGSVTRPVRELKGFQRINLEPGTEQVVNFEITTKDLAFYTANRKWEAEPGEFMVFIGGNAQAEESAKFTLK